MSLSGRIMCRKCPLGSSRHILSLDFLSDPLVLTVPQWDVSCASSLAAVTSRVSYRKPCSSLSSEIHPGLVLQPAGMLTFPSVSNLLLLSIIGLLMNGRSVLGSHHLLTSLCFASWHYRHFLCKFQFPACAPMDLGTGDPRDSNTQR